MADAGRVRELFERATELPREERGAFLAGACAGDASLRAEVESLLAFDGVDDAFLEERPSRPRWRWRPGWGCGFPSGSGVTG